MLSRKNTQSVLCNQHAKSDTKMAAAGTCTSGYYFTRSQCIYILLDVAPLRLQPQCPRTFAIREWLLLDKVVMGCRLGQKSAHPTDTENIVFLLSILGCSPVFANHPRSDPATSMSPHKWSVARTDGQTDGQTESSEI